MPTIDDLVADLNGSTVFTTLDLSSGYHQLELAKESRHITTFSTHLGLRRYKRLLFGINAASEIFQNTIEELPTGLPGCKITSDDIIVFGKDQATHDANLRQVLERLQSHNLRLNKEKCHFSKSDVMFYGHVSAQMNYALITKRLKLFRMPQLHVIQAKSNLFSERPSTWLATYPVTLISQLHCAP